MSLERLRSVGTRLSQISVRAFSNPHTRFTWPEKPDPDRFAMSEKLLALAGHPRLATLGDEQRWKLALLEAIQFFSINIAGERELMMGLAERFYVGPLAACSEYLQHFLHEENAHTVVFATFCQKYGGKIYPDKQMRLERKYLPGERDFLFYAQVLIFEEVANYYNQEMAADEDLWPLAREINDYHATDEGRHIAFGREAVEELWTRSSPAWGDEGRAQVATYLEKYMETVLRGYLNPAVLRDLGLDGDLLELREELFALPERKAIGAAATERVRAFLVDRGILMIDPAEIPGLTWNAEGTVGLSGAVLTLFERLDAAFVELARSFEAAPHSFVPVLAARDLKAIDYFASFPHLITMPVSIDREPANLKAFSQANAQLDDQPLTLAKLGPTSSVLAPAACYAVYPSLRGTALDAPKQVTVLGTCFRREDHYEPLRRQWCFRMRELVHVGTGESAQAFLAEGERKVRALAAALELPISTAPATDPFFDPARSSKYLHQKLFPTKHEVLFEGLAIGSFNYHRNFFGEAFALSCNGAAAHTACVAFGVERWVWAILTRHGTAERSWPRALDPSPR